MDAAFKSLYEYTNIKGMPTRHLHLLEVCLHLLRCVYSVILSRVVLLRELTLKACVHSNGDAYDMNKYQCFFIKAYVRDHIQLRAWVVGIIALGQRSKQIHFCAKSTKLPEIRDPF